MNRPEAQGWIEHEDAIARSERIARLEWLASEYPVTDPGFMLEGGWLSLRLLEEAKYCFAYGQFLATAVLGVAFIERVFAARFYAIGRDELERAGILDLLGEALKSKWLSQEEFDQLDKIRRLRNPIIHFRRPLGRGTIERRAVRGATHPDESAEADAREILMSVFRVLQRCAV